MEEVLVSHLYQQQPRKVRIKLDRGKGGAYSWEIDAEGETSEEVISKLKQANNRMKQEFGE